MEKYAYLLLNLLCVIVPFLFSFHPKIRFNRNWISFWPACILSAAIFIAWDIAFTHLGVWGFNPRYLMGVYIFNIPLEECLFFICIPYASVFTYHCFYTLLRKDYLRSYYNYVSLFLIILLAFTGILYAHLLYTGVTFIALALFLLFCLLTRQAWLSRFYAMYAIILFPFAIVNGILTGSFIAEPIVWYNNHQNLAIRLGTIPVEDVFYGMLLLLLNVMIYEYLLAKRAK